MCKWSRLVMERAEWRRNANIAETMLTENYNLYRTVFAITDLAKWFIQGLGQFLASMKPPCQNSDSSSYFGIKKVNMSQDIGSLLKKSSAWVFPCYNRMSGILRFFTSKKPSLLHSTDAKLSNFIGRGAFLIQAMDFSSACVSLKSKINKFMKKKRKLSIGGTWRTLYKLKTAIIGISSIFSLGQPLSPKVNLAVDTIHTCYTMGRMIVKRGWVADPVQEMQMECHMLGVKSFQKSQITHSNFEPVLKYI